MIQAALDGVGLAYVPDFIAAHMAEGKLVRLLTGWCPTYPGFYLYYPARSISSALKALIATLQEDAVDDGCSARQTPLGTHKACLKGCFRQALSIAENYCALMSRW